MTTCVCCSAARQLGRPRHARRTQPGPGGWNRIHFVYADLDAEIARLKAEGVQFRNDAVSGPGGQQILVQDPSGNLMSFPAGLGLKTTTSSSTNRKLPMSGAGTCDCSCVSRQPLAMPASTSVIGMSLTAASGRDRNTSTW